MIGFTNKRDRFVSKQLEIRNAVFRVIAITGGDCDILSLNVSLSMGTCGRRFCRAFSIKLAICQRNCRISRLN